MDTGNFPATGLAPEDVHAEMELARRGDVDWRRGRLGLYVHFGGDDVLEVAKEAHRRFFSENALGQKAFPSLKKFEDDLVAWSANLLHARPQATGVVSSGGTESIFLAVKTARDQARVEKAGISQPEIVAPVSAHPAFDKAAHYLCMKVRRVPLRPDFRADVAAMRAAVTSSTVMVVGSAPAFPHGVIDPIEEIGALALEQDLWMHVDACVGGFLAPFVKQIGYPIPPFDFEVAGVRSMSADLHKYGFTAKGASVMLLADLSLRKHLVFEFDDWPRGSYAAATFAGSRPGATIAAAWAVMRYLGRDGYLRLARQIMDARDRMIAGIKAIAGLRLVGSPDLTIFAFGSDDLDIFAIAGQMTQKGWFTSTMRAPAAIHMGMPTVAQAQVVDEYLSDLAAAVEEVRAGNLTTAASDGSYAG